MNEVHAAEFKAGLRERAQRIRESNATTADDVAFLMEGIASAMKGGGPEQQPEPEQPAEPAAPIEPVEPAAPAAEGAAAGDQQANG